LLGSLISTSHSFFFWVFWFVWLGLDGRKGNYWVDIKMSTIYFSLSIFYSKKVKGLFWDLGVLTNELLPLFLSLILL
jgi:hypothetical protein